MPRLLAAPLVALLLARAMFCDGCVRACLRVCVCVQVQQHLGIDEAPSEVHAGVAEKCIPQYTTGHPQRRARAQDALRDFGHENVTAIGTSLNGSFVR